MRAPPTLSTAFSTAVSTARRALRQYIGELRASRAFLASEVSHAGWLDLGQFRWRDATSPSGRACRDYTMASSMQILAGDCLLSA